MLSVDRPDLVHMTQVEVWMAKEANPFDREDFKGQVIDEYAGLTEEEADEVVLKQLRSRGSDLARPRHIVHHLYFASAEQRGLAAATVRQHGYEPVVPNEDQSDEAYLLIAGREGIADGASITNDRNILNAVAEEHDGWYDGWAAAGDR